MDQDELSPLRRKLRQQISRQGILSVQSTKNLRKAAQTLCGMIKVREAVLTFWERCLDLSPGTFVLVSNTFSTDTVNRIGKLGRERILDIVKHYDRSLLQHEFMDKIAAEYGITAIAGSRFLK
jgi:hypothetical protein